MKRLVLGVMASITISSLAPPAWSKGTTVKLVVSGATLPSPVEITDPEIVGRFSIWNGPGVSVNGKPVHLDPDNPGSAFIDWPRGRPAEKPAGLARYEVTFFIDGRARGRYHVLYEFRPATPGGYIYLPGRGDLHGSGNTRFIAHGVEGYWFHSSGAWERHVRPIIRAAARKLGEAGIEERNRLLATGDFESAEVLFRAAFERDAADLRARTLLAYSLINQSKSELAATHLDYLVEHEYGFLGELGLQWTRYGANRAGVAEAALAMSDPDAQASFLFSAAAGWGESDAAPAQDWLLHLPAGRLRDWAIAGLARGMANAGRALAPGAASAFSSETVREQELGRVIVELAFHSPDKARALLDGYVADPQRKERIERFLERRGG